MAELFAPRIELLLQFFIVPFYRLKPSPSGGTALAGILAVDLGHGTT
jgi:hypothetical protein